MALGMGVRSIRATYLKISPFVSSCCTPLGDGNSFKSGLVTAWFRLLEITTLTQGDGHQLLGANDSGKKPIKKRIGQQNKR